MKYHKDETNNNMMNIENLVKYEKKILEEILQYEDPLIETLSYCCYGLDECCWFDYDGDGSWDFNVEDIRRIISKQIKMFKKYLYKEPRVFKLEKSYYFYLRDIIGKDFAISERKAGSVDV